MTEVTVLTPPATVVIIAPRQITVIAGREQAHVVTVGTQGPAGPQGPQGPTGPQGEDADSTSEATPGTTAERDAAGTFEIGVATGDAHPVRKLEFDAALSDISAALDTINGEVV